VGVLFDGEHKVGERGIAVVPSQILQAPMERNSPYRQPQQVTYDQVQAMIAAEAERAAVAAAQQRLAAEAAARAAEQLELANDHAGNAALSLVKQPKHFLAGVISDDDDDDDDNSEVCAAVAI
jgi:hypothetical protein